MAAGLALIFWAVGCASPVARRVVLSFPTVALAAGEYVQSITVEIHGGRVTSIDRLVDDWDAALTWDSPEQLKVDLEARHFSSGLPTLARLDRCLTLEATGPAPPRITATIRMESTEPSGRPDRQLTLADKDLVLMPANRTRR